MGKWGETRDRVRELMERHPGITTARLAELTGFSEGYIRELRREIRCGEERRTKRPMSPEQKMQGVKSGICIVCARAGGGYGCPFVDNCPSGETPVEGWTAEKVERTNNSNGVLYPYEQWKVKSCPLFVPDGELEALPREEITLGGTGTLEHMCSMSWGGVKNKY